MILLGILNFENLELSRSSVRCAMKVIRLQKFRLILDFLEVQLMRRSVRSRKEIVPREKFLSIGGERVVLEGVGNRLMGIVGTRGS